MKPPVITLIFVFLLLRPSLAQPEWEVLFDGRSQMSWPMGDFIHPDTGWVRSGDKLYQTTDGCVNWTLLWEGDLLRDLDFINASTGWAIIWDDDEKSSIMKSLDGGNIWIRQKTVNEDLTGLFVLSDQLAYALGRHLYKTADGGANWEDITPSGQSLSGVAAFANSDTGIVTGRGQFVVYRTFDGGKSWSTIAISPYRGISHLQFTNDTSACFVAREGESGDSLYLMETRDFFNTCNELSASDQSIYSCKFFDNGNILLAARDSLGGNMDLMKSTDGGVSWDTTHLYVYTSPGYIPEFQGDLLFSGDVGYFMGNELFLMKSMDRGDSWSMLDIWVDLTDVHITDRNTGIIAGGTQSIHYDGKNIFTTGDGGRSWKHIYQTDDVRSVDFVNDSLGFMTHWGGFSTSFDGGYSWHPDATMEGVQQMGFITDSMVWVIKYDHSEMPAEIYFTENQGKEWNLFPGGFFEFEGGEILLDINAACFLDLETSWVLGETHYRSNVLLKYTEESGWEKFEPGYGGPLKKISFIDREIGWISGGYSGGEDSDAEFAPVFLRSEDGGETWSEIDNLDYLVNDFYFEDRDHGWAVGCDRFERGVVLETFNGGQNWEVVKEGLAAPLNSLHFNDSIGWAVGDKGLILRSERYKASSLVSRFMVVGDMHHSAPSPHLDSTMLYELAMAAIREEVDFIFFTGDLMVRDFSSPEEEDAGLGDWRFVLDTLEANWIQVLACRGNNDSRSGQGWDTLFSGIRSFPQNGPELEKNRTYAAEFDNMLLIALDLYTEAHQINQVWLDSLLAASSSDHIFVAGHESAFKVSMVNAMGAFPEERNRFWESLTGAGVKAYFCGHDHFYDHARIDDGDGDPGNDIHQLIVGTGGAGLFADGAYDWDNGRWTPERIFHEEAHGYLLVELKGENADMTWKHRTGRHTFEAGGDSFRLSPHLTYAGPMEQEDVILQSYPNPFTSSTTISYQLRTACRVELHIYDMLGRKVSTLVDDLKPAGNNEVYWDAGERMPGVYILEMVTGQERQVIRMVKSASPN